MTKPATTTGYCKELNLSPAKRIICVKDRANMRRRTARKMVSTPRRETRFVTKEPATPPNIPPATMRRRMRISKSGYTVSCKCEKKRCTLREKDDEDRVQCSLLRIHREKQVQKSDIDRASPDTEKRCYDTEKESGQQRQDAA